MLDSKVSIDMSTILATCAHDIKNSLSMITQALDELKDFIPTESTDAVENYALLYYETSRINNELVQLLSFYRLQHQQLVLSKQQQFILDIVEEQVARNNYLFHYRGIIVDVECDENLSWFLDDYLIGCLLNNIIVNAARYTKDKILIISKQVDDQLLLQVHDNGSGFIPEMIECQQACGNPAPRTGHTYLGLYFAQEIAKSHQQEERCGQISLSNDSIINGSGGCFSLLLP